LQLPFSSLDLGADINPFARDVSRAILEAEIAGVGGLNKFGEPLHLTPTFPIIVFQCKKGVNDTPDTPNYDLRQLALRCAMLRLTPNFVNLDVSTANSNPDNPDTWMSTMGT